MPVAQIRESTGEATSPRSPGSTRHFAHRHRPWANRSELKQVTEAARSRTEVILSLVRREKPTLRRLLASLTARGHFTAAGTPGQIADLIEDSFTDGAADGFNIMPPLLPGVLDTLSAKVIPLLQRRRLFRTRSRRAGSRWPKARYYMPR